MTTKVGVVVLYPLEGRQKYQRQIEKLIMYQSHPVKNFRIAIGKDQIQRSAESSRLGGADLVLVMDATGFYARDYVETQAMKWEADGRPEAFEPWGEHVYCLKKGAIYPPAESSPYPIGLVFQSDAPKGKATAYSLPEITRTETSFYQLSYSL